MTKGKILKHHADGTWEIDGKTFIINVTKTEQAFKDLPIKDRDRIHPLVLEEDNTNKEALVIEITKLLYDQLTDLDREDYFRTTLFEAVKETDLESLKDLKERLTGTKKPSIKKKRECFSLMVGGKSGPPLELNIVGNQRFD